MQRTPENVKSVIIADKQSKSFRIALSVLKNTFDKDVITKALIDSGAPINCLDWGFVKNTGYPTIAFPNQSVPETWMDQTMNPESSSSSPPHSFASKESSTESCSTSSIVETRTSS